MGSLNVTIIIFFISLVFFHCIMWWKGKNRKFWIKVDYFWLGIAALGLIGATGEVRKLYAESQLWLSEMGLESSVTNAKDSANFGSFFYNRLMLYSLNWTQTDVLVKRASIVREAAKWFDEASLKLKLSIDGNDWKDLLSANKKVEEMTTKDDYEDTILQDKKKLIGYIQKALEAKNRLEEQKKSMKSNDAEVILTLLSPWLLSIALALRITKVTADLKNFTG